MAPRELDDANRDGLPDAPVGRRPRRCRRLASLPIPLVPVLWRVGVMETSRHVGGRGDQGRDDHDALPRPHDREQAGRLSKAVERFSKVLARMQKKTPLRGFCDRWDLCREETFTRLGNWHHHGNLILWLKQELDEEAALHLLEEVRRAWVEAGNAAGFKVDAKFKPEPVPRYRWNHEMHYAMKCPTL